MIMFKVNEQLEEFLDLMVSDLELLKVFGTSEEAKEALLHSLNKDREDLIYQLLIEEQQGNDIDETLGSLRLLIGYFNHNEYKN